MLSVSRIKTASRAAAYYGRDDYYVAGEADSPGLRWGGKAAVRLGMEGAATEADFKAVLSGSNPQSPGPPMGAPEKGRPHHPGWDFTFSAPKGISLAILVGGDARMDVAHDRAVAKAMEYAEKHLSFTRVREAGQRREAATDNLLYATTVHGVSRAGDPQRHTHVVIANATWHHASGTWRALESRHLYRRRRLLGKIYQAELAKGALELGYDVRPEGGEGVYDLAAWTREQLRVFAKRTQAIARALEIEKPATPAAREAVKLKDRPRKIGVAREELRARWQAEAKGAGIDVDRVVAEAHAKPIGEAHAPAISGRVSERLSRLRALVGRLLGDEGAPDPYACRSREIGRDLEARGAVSAALQIQEIRSAVFTRHDVLERALDWAAPNVGIDRLVQDLGRLEFDEKVRSAGRQLPDGITTSNALAVETEIVNRLHAGRGKGAAVWPGEEAPERINAVEAGSNIRLNLGQRQAALLVLGSQDRYVAIQGSAGVGKTTMFKVVRAAAAEGGYEITAITPTHRAAAAMRSEAGVHATTVAAWLRSMGKAMRTGSGLREAREHWKARILVVDEASMTSNVQMLAIVQTADRLGIPKAVLMGDERQLGSPEAGAPFRMALNRDLEQSRMRAILRQKDPTLRAAVAQLAEGKAPEALRRIDQHIQALGRNADDAALAGAAVRAWKTGASVGDAPRIIVPTNLLRATVADLVRAERIDAGELAAEAVTVERYQHVRLEGPERHTARAHRLGHRLVFHAALASAGIRRGAEADVVGLDLRNDVLRIGTALGDASIDLRALARAGRIPFDVYQAKLMNVAVGEQLVWERADPRRRYMTGAGFTVVGITDQHWTIRHHDGRDEQLRADDPALRFIGYDYAETADRAQGQTYRSVVAVLASRHGEAVTAARQYVMQSRPSHAFTLITDDKRLLVRRLAEQDGLGLIATENLGAALVSAMPSPPAREAPESDLARHPAPRSAAKDHGRSM